jgi:hypothetical protein
LSQKKFKLPTSTAPKSWRLQINTHHHHNIYIQQLSKVDHTFVNVKAKTLQEWIPFPYQFNPLLDLGMMMMVVVVGHQLKKLKILQEELHALLPLEREQVVFYDLHGMKNQLDQEVPEDFISQKFEETQYVLDHQIYNKSKNEYP